MGDKISMSTIKVTNGKIVISEAENSMEDLWIRKSNNVSLYVDGEAVQDRVKVNSESNIEVVFPDSEAKRELNIDVTEDKMIAKISIGYIPQIKYSLEDTEESRMAVLKETVVEEVYPPKFTRDEIVDALKKKGIVYGLDSKAIGLCANAGAVEDIIVAKGKQPVEPIDDSLNILFEDKKSDKFKSDGVGNIDFKSIGNVVSVKVGEVLATREVGKDGTIGVDIFSHPIQPRKRIVKDIIIKNGCKFKDKNTIVATVEGHPQVKGCVFQVSDVHEVIGDVDISTGNINFIGDVVIGKDITEGMSVKVGNKLVVNGNVVRCNAWSEGDLIVKGSSISSRIKVKSEVSELHDYIKSLEAALEIFKKVKADIATVKSSEGYSKNISDGNLIKLIIQTKFPKFNSIVKLLSEKMEVHHDDQNELYRILKIKYVTRNYTLISKSEELQHVCDLIVDKIDGINNMKDVKSNAYFSYVQDCDIYSSGSIYIEGKGVYKSEIYAEEGIYFTNDGNCDLRGGRLFAEHEIKVKEVGAETGVTTDLEVGKKGHIYCDIAHYNTRLKVGNMTYIIEESCRNLHAYIDKNMELIVEKLKL